MCLVVFLGRGGMRAVLREQWVVVCSWDEAGPCAQRSPFLGLTDAGGTQLSAIVYILKTFPAFSSFPRDLSSLPDLWGLLPSTGAPTSPQQI